MSKAIVAKTRPRCKSSSVGAVTGQVLLMHSQELQMVATWNTKQRTGMSLLRLEVSLKQCFLRRCDDRSKQIRRQKATRS